MVTELPGAASTMAQTGNLKSDFARQCVSTELIDTWVPLLSEQWFQKASAYIQIWFLYRAFDRQMKAGVPMRPAGFHLHYQLLPYWCSGATLNWCLELWPGKAFSIGCARGGCYQAGRCCVQTGTLRGMHCWRVGTHRRCVRLGWCMHCWGESSLQQGCAGTPGRHHHELEWSQGCCHLQALDVSSPIFALSPLHKQYAY